LIEYGDDSGDDNGSKFQSKMNYDKVPGPDRGFDPGFGIDGPSPF